MRRRNLAPQKEGVYWCSSLIAKLREACPAKYKIFQRSIKRKGPVSSLAEHDEYRQAKRALQTDIKVSKERYWSELSVEPDRDPPGFSFKFDHKSFSGDK